MLDGRRRFYDNMEERYNECWMLKVSITGAWKRNMVGVKSEENMHMEERYGGC